MTEFANCIKKHGDLKIKDLSKVLANIEKFCNSLRANKVAESQKLFLGLPIVVQCFFLANAWKILSKKAPSSDDDSYLTAFRLFKLFRSKDMKGKTSFSEYNKKQALEIYYKNAFEWNKKNDGSKIKKQVKLQNEEASQAGEVAEEADDAEEAEEEVEVPAKSAKSTSSKSASSKSTKSTPAKSAKKASSKSASSRTKKKYSKTYQRYEAPSGELDPLYIYYTSLYGEDPKSRLAITWLTEHGVYDNEERKDLVAKYEKLVAKNKLIK